MLVASLTVIFIVTWAPDAPGAGIADDKAIYSYMPEIIKFYTGETPLLDNIPTWKCSDAESLRYVLENLRELVVKEVFPRSAIRICVVAWSWQC